MNIPRDLDELTALFKKFGARDPTVWAKSQLEEGIPQLQRFLFLRQAWRNVVSENDAGSKRISRAIAQVLPISSVCRREPLLISS